MEEKVTSYELSKKLHDLKFECKTHCRWWVEFRNANTQEIEWRYCDYVIAGDGVNNPTGIRIKAYDCWDLLMWLQRNYQVDKKNKKIWWYQVEIGSPDFDVLKTNGLLQIGLFTQNKEPQNAFAKAIIEILKEKNIIESN